MDIIMRHKLITAIIVVMLIGAAWYEFTGTSAAPASILQTTGVATGTGEASIVSTLLQLQAVNLDGTVLANPAFLSLQDFTTQVVNEPTGRPDPFAPLSGAPVSTTSSAKVSPNLFAPAKQ